MIVSGIAVVRNGVCDHKQYRSSSLSSFLRMVLYTSREASSTSAARICGAAIYALVGAAIESISHFTQGIGRCYFREAM